MHNLHWAGKKSIIVITHQSLGCRILDLYMDQLSFSILPVGATEFDPKMQGLKRKPRHLCTVTMTVPVQRYAPRITGPNSVEPPCTRALPLVLFRLAAYFLSSVRRLSVVVIVVIVPRFRRRRRGRLVHVAAAATGVTVVPLVVVVIVAVVVISPARTITDSVNIRIRFKKLSSNRLS